MFIKKIVAINISSSPVFPNWCVHIISSQCDINTRSDDENTTYLDFQLLVDSLEPIAGCSGYTGTYLIMSA